VAYPLEDGEAVDEEVEVDLLLDDFEDEVSVVEAHDDRGNFLFFCIFSMKELVGLTGVLSVYEYKLPHGEIPLVIVKKEIDRARLREEFGRSK